MKAISSGISLRALGYLVALSEERHFGRAAERCFVSQPTLSAQIKKLEEQLGVQLVERSQRRVMLSDIGEQIVARARQVLQEVDAVCDLARGYQDPLSGELRVGLIPTVGPYLLPMVSPALRKALPELKLYLLEYQTSELMEKLDRGDVDLAILALPIEDGGLEIVPLYDEQFLAALPAGHSLSRKQQLTVKDMDAQTLLLLADGHCLRDQALEVCSQVEVDEPQDFRATSLETLRQMVATGLGITLLPALATEEPFAGIPGLVVRPFRGPAPGREIAAAWRKTSPRGPAMQEICSVIRRAVSGASRFVRSA